MFSSYFNKTISLDELLDKLDYEQVAQQRDLLDFLNFILTKEIPHYCYNKECNEKLFFSNVYYYNKIDGRFTLKEFVKIWSAPHNLKQFSKWKIDIPFYCCKCFKKQIMEAKTIHSVGHNSY